MNEERSGAASSPPGEGRSLTRPASGIPPRDDGTQASTQLLSVWWAISCLP
jgi:hypothetical protein